MRKLALFIMLFMLCGMVFADSLNVLVYPENAEISSYIQALLPKARLDGMLRAQREERLEYSQLKALGEKLAAAYGKEDEKSIAEAKEEYLGFKLPAEEEFLEVTLIGTENKSFSLQEILSGDREYLRYVCLECDADVLVVPVSSKVGGFYHLALYRYIYGEDRLSLVFERVSADSDMFTPSCMIRFASGLIDGIPALVRLDGIAVGATVLIDGQISTPADGYVMTTEGRHTFSISAQGHQNRSFAVDAVGNSLIALDASLPAIVYSNMMITTNPASTVSINGEVLGQTPVTLDSYSLPLSIRFDKDLYVSRNVGLTESTSSLSFDLKPAWMIQEPILKKKKDAFYWAFARSFLLFGAKLALGVFNDGSNKVLSSLDIASNGILTVSIVDAVACLVDYYRQTEYISP